MGSVDEVQVIARADQSNLRFRVFVMALLLMPAVFFLLLSKDGPTNEVSNCDVAEPEFWCRFHLPKKFQPLPTADAVADHATRRSLTVERLAPELGVDPVVLSRLLKPPLSPAPERPTDPDAVLHQQTLNKIAPIPWRPYDVGELAMLAQTELPQGPVAQKLLDNDDRFYGERATRLREEIALRESVLRPIWTGQTTRRHAITEVMGLAIVGLLAGIVYAVVLMFKRRAFVIRVTRNEVQFGNRTVSAEALQPNQVFSATPFTILLEGERLVLPVTHQLSDDHREVLVEALRSVVRTAEGVEQPEQREALSSLTETR